jgi:hypothetical protein
MSLETEFQQLVNAMKPGIPDDMLQKLVDFKAKIAELEKKFKLYDDMIEMSASQRY